MNNVVDIESQEQLETLIRNNLKVVVDFHAPSWCAPCRALHLHIVKTAERIDDVVFATVDIDKNEWSLEQYNFMSVPTVKMFTNGEAVDIKGRTVIQLMNEIV